METFYMLIQLLVLITITTSSCNQKTNDLEGSSWDLISLNGESLIESIAITLEFTDTYLGGRMGCNNYGGSPDSGGYRIGSGGAFNLEYPIPVIVQLYPEPIGIMIQEEAYIGALKAAASYKIADDGLTFVDPSGKIILIYQVK